MVAEVQHVAGSGVVSVGAAQEVFRDLQYGWPTCDNRHLSC